MGEIKEARAGNEIKRSKRGKGAEGGATQLESEDEGGTQEKTSI
jgi:hypothetical protein